MGLQRILVTGATGFVGRHLVAHLLSERRPLTLAVRKADGCPACWRNKDHVRIVETGAIERCSSLENALSDVSIVVHAAGLAHVNSRNARDADALFMRANAEATEKLAQAVVRSGARQFINLSSLHAIAANSSPTIVNDETDNEPSTPYSMSKRQAERHVLNTVGRGVFAVSLRPPLVVGSDARGNWRSLQWIAATGLPLPFGRIHNRRSMIGKDTIVQMISHLCSKAWPTEKSGNYCIADPDAMSLRSIVTELRRGMNLPPRLFPVPAFLLHSAAKMARQHRQAMGLFGNLEIDGSRFRHTFGFTSTRTLREAIRESGTLYVAAAEKVETRPHR
jgi:UDP-glucose 4-epimerase